MIHHYIMKYWEDGEHSHHEEIRIGNGAELEERLKMMERKADEKPYDHCWDCELSAKNGGPCKVHDKYQRLPREEYGGALGMCMKIGGPGC